MGSWEVMKIRGIPLRIHASWFFVLLYFTLSARDQYETVLDSQAFLWNGWVLGAFTSLLLFLSVLLHELAHCFVAIGEGIKVRDITLFFLGGMANLEKECTTSKGSFKIAIFKLPSEVEHSFSRLTMPPRKKSVMSLTFMPSPIATKQ